MIEKLPNTFKNFHREPENEVEECLVKLARKINEILEYLAEKEEKELNECHCTEPNTDTALLGNYACCTWCGKPKRKQDTREEKCTHSEEFACMKCSNPIGLDTLKQDHIDVPELNVEELLDEYGSAYHCSIVYNNPDNQVATKKRREKMNQILEIIKSAIK